MTEAATLESGCRKERAAVLPPTNHLWLGPGHRLFLSSCPPFPPSTLTLFLASAALVLLLTVLLSDTRRRDKQSCTHLKLRYVFIFIYLVLRSA
jgi:hypothetical protein